MEQINNELIGIKDHKTLYVEAINRGLTPLSASQVSLFQTCKHSWKLKYIDKLSFFSPSIQMLFGTSMHETIQKWLELRFNESVSAGNSFDMSKYLNERLILNYREEMKKEGAVHFSTKEELKEFYNDGKLTLIELKKNQDTLFSVTDYELEGIELPLLVESNVNPKIALYGFLDIVLKSKTSDKRLIRDLKTSTSGWKDSKKSDFNTLQQLIIYKQYYSKQFNVSVDDIDIEFIILKRKLWENSPYAQKRIQSFIPSSGKVNLKKSETILSDFITYVFNNEGQIIKDKDYPVTENPNNCIYCDFKKHNACYKYNKNLLNEKEKNSNIE